MEHHLLEPLTKAFLKTEKTYDDISALNIACFYILKGEYLSPTYDNWKLAEVKEGHFRLEQNVLDIWTKRDPANIFYESWHWDSESEYSVKPLKLEYKSRADNIKRFDVNDDLPKHLMKRAEKLIDEARKINPELINKLLSPTNLDIEKRQEVKIEVFNSDEFDKKIRKILGNTFDSTLKTYGMGYHTHPSYMDKKDLFILAHNNEEVAGVLKISVMRDWTYAVGYVCVAPGWRERGLSKKLYSIFIKKCQDDKKVLIRTSPGNDTPVKATICYDEMVKKARVVHMNSECSLMHMADLLQKKGIDVAERVDELKGICDMAVPSKSDRENKILDDFKRRNYIAQQAQPIYEKIINEKESELKKDKVKKIGM